ncbi:MAG: LuxR family transcriptional regulator [Nocardioidaceae bacterium]
MGYDSEHRLLLDTLGAEIYSKAVAHGYIAADDPRYASDSELGQALALLADLGLVWLDEAARRYHPVDPAAVQSAVVVPLATQGNNLLMESAQWSEAFHALGQTFRASPQATVSPVTEIHGVDKINAFLTTATADCRVELLTAQPYGKRPTSQLSRAEDRDMQALDRGVRMRTLYQHSSRHGPATREYVAEMIKRGAEVRTLDEFFRRLFVFDRKLAVIPASEDHTVAIAIYDKSIVGYLVDIFERSWERGMSFTLKGDTVEHTIAADVRAMTMRLLVEGHSDVASAKRLGISTRTYAGYIATLKEEYGVQTRFQLGWAMARDVHGSGTEDRPCTEVMDPLEG